MCLVQEYPFRSYLYIPIFDDIKVESWYFFLYKYGKKGVIFDNTIGVNLLLDKGLDFLYICFGTKFLNVV